MAGETYIPSYLGNIILHKTAGASANPAVDAEWFLPISRIVPFNLRSNSYPGIIDGSNYPSVKYTGKRRPGFTIFFYCRPNSQASTPFNGFNLDLLNALLFNMSGTPSKSDRWSCRIYNSVQTRVWDWARCTNVILTGGASGGPLVVQAGFTARWGENEKPATGSYLPDGEAVPADVTWGTWNTQTVAGNLAEVIDYDFCTGNTFGTAANNSYTATGVRGFVLHLMRGQGPVDYIDGTRHCKEIATGKFSGALQLDINPSTNTIPTTAATLRIHTNYNTVSNQAVKIAMDLSLDSVDQPEDVGISTATYNYTLYDSTGQNPAEPSSFTPT